MFSFTDENRKDLLGNYIETIHQLKLRDECWDSILNDPECPFDKIPSYEKNMITKHHQRERRFYETQRDMYVAISQGDMKNMDIRRTALLHYARCVMDDMIEADVYEEALYVNVCDGFKDKIDKMDTWINAVK